jgi:serine/threonine protein kinase/tetratricopeptide (TPR) repeat protein
MSDLPRDVLRDQLQSTLGASCTLTRELGGGGMSRVFVARDVALDRDVVVKVLAPELAAGVSAERFAREIKLAAGLQQANIVPLLSAGETEGLPYYTMPFVDGLSLRARLERNGALPVGEAVSVLRDVTRALAYAHERGVVHRDIKPENILLSGDAAVVTDFGIAKALSASRTQAPGGTLTQVGTSIGTPAYMAPEQASGDPATDHRADLYALGCVAYEMLAGAAPFAGRPTHQLFTAHLTEVPAPLGGKRADVQPALGKLVARLLEKDPARRPQTAREVLQALDGMSTGTGAASAPRSSRRRNATIAGIAAGLVIITSMAFVAWRGSHRAGDAGAAVSAVAVLPFENASGDTASNYFADGMTDELALGLAKVPGLRVASRTSSYTFRKHEGLDARAIAAKLGVGAIVEGTVRRVGNQLRVTAQLTRGSDGQSLWADGFTANADSVLAVQARLTQAIVAAVAPALAGKPAAAAATALATASKTKDAAAYDLYLRGRYELNRRGNGVRRSIALFEQALARDPGFGDAWAGLAVAWSALPDYDSSAPVTLAFDSTRVAARRAIALDSLGWEPWAAIGSAYQLASHLDSAEVALRRSIALAPRQAIPHRWLGLAYARLGHFEQAEREQRIAVELDPLSAGATSNLANTLALKPSGRTEARALARRAAALDPANFTAITLGALTLFLTGDYDESLRMLRGASDTSARVGYVAAAWAGDLIARGQRDSVVALLRYYERLPATNQNMSAVATAAAALGQWDRAFALMDSIVARGGDAAFSFVDDTMTPLLRPVVDDPRLRAVAERAHRDYGQLARQIRESVPLPARAP